MQLFVFPFYCFLFVLCPKVSFIKSLFSSPFFYWAKPGLCARLEPSVCNFCTFMLRIYNISGIQRAEAAAGTSGCGSSRAAGAGCSEVQLAQTPHGQPPLLHPNTFFTAFTNRCGVSSACPSQEPTKYPPVKCPHPAPPKSSLGKELFPPAHETASADSDVSPLASLAPLHSCKKIIRGGKNPPVRKCQVRCFRANSTWAEICLNKQEQGEHRGLGCSVFSLEL